MHWGMCDCLHIHDCSLELGRNVRLNQKGRGYDRHSLHVSLHLLTRELIVSSVIRSKFQFRWVSQHHRAFVSCSEALGWRTVCKHLMGRGYQQLGFGWGYRRPALRWLEHNYKSPPKICDCALILRETDARDTRLPFHSCEVYIFDAGWYKHWCFDVMFSKVM